MEFSAAGQDARSRCVFQRETKMDEDRMMKWFAYAHLPQDLQPVSMVFHTAARELLNRLDPGPERTVAFRKLLEAKDAAVRAKVHPGG